MADDFRASVRKLYFFHEKPLGPSSNSVMFVRERCLCTRTATSVAATSDRRNGPSGFLLGRFRLFWASSWFLLALSLRPFGSLGAILWSEWLPTATSDKRNGPSGPLLVPFCFFIRS